MGRVLVAHDPVLGRDVAVKLLRDDLLVPRDVREGLLARMRHEARAAARVAHPNLVTLHDMGEDDKLGLYLVFEYVEGPTLKQRLTSGPLPPAEAARLARELGTALTFAHKEGILHRDIKPENIILSRTGGKIADFGIAKIPDSTLTHAGGLMGTPAYSAPETFGGKNFSPESDQFSLAASLYEAVSGERAFPGDDAVEVAARIANDPPSRFAARRGLPPAVDDVLVRAMAKSPADRFASCEAFGEALADALTPFLEAPPRSAAPSSPSNTTALASLPPPDRKRGQILLGAAVVAVTATLLVRTAMHREDPAPDAAGRSLAQTEPSASASPSPRALPPAQTSRPARPRPGADGTPEGATSAAATSAEPPDTTPEPPDAGPSADASAPDASSPVPAASALPSASPSPAPSAAAPPPATSAHRPSP
ncbi:protein kinase [Polyangium aurulentum]|nr:protein kinase [Polyangium aurulentum]